jgi:hypothetical protein
VNVPPAPPKYAKQALRRIAPAQVASPLETRTEVPASSGPERKRLVVVLDIDIGLDRQVLAKRQAQLARTYPTRKPYSLPPGKRARHWECQRSVRRRLSRPHRQRSARIAESKISRAGHRPGKGNQHGRQRARSHACHYIPLQESGYSVRRDHIRKPECELSSKKTTCTEKTDTWSVFLNVQSPSSTGLFNLFGAPVAPTQANHALKFDIRQVQPSSASAKKSRAILSSLVE